MREQSEVRPGIQQWSYTTKDCRLTVYEGLSAYYIIDNSSGKEACLGDGVGMFFTEKGKAIKPGTRKFNKLFSHLIEMSTEDYLEAYFPEEVDIVVYKPCNGYTNYPTWAYCLWACNDKEVNKTNLAMAEKALAESDEDITKARNSLSNVLRNEFEANLPDNLKGAYSDMLTFAINVVNWHEVAEHYIQNI